MIELQTDESHASILRKGAYVESLILNGVDILKKTIDGVQPHGGLSVMIPYADIVSNARYSFNGKEYRLPKNAGYEGDYINSMHGLVLDKTWKVIDRKNNEIKLGLSLTEKCYPSKLMITVHYMIRSSEFEVFFKVKNVGKKDAPIMCGSHPYLLFDGYWKFQFHDAVVLLKNTDKLSVTTNRLKYNKITSLGGRQYDNAYFGGGEVDFVTRRKKIKIRRYNMPFFEIYNGIYSNPGSVAFEPLTGAPNCFNNRIGLKILKGNEEMNCGFSLALV